MYALPVGCRCLSSEFFELPHKMHIVYITAEIRDFSNPHSAGSQIVFCKGKPGCDNILLAGAMEKIFI